MDGLDRLLPLLLRARTTVEIELATGDPSTVEYRQARLIRVELDLLIGIMQAPWAVRLPLLAAAVLVRLARG